MAEEDDDYLDLCDENSSPLPDFNATCDASKHLGELDKCVTISSSDLEPESLENYSDFESEDEQDKKDCRSSSSAKCDQNSNSDEIILLSPKKGNKIFTYSPVKSRTSTCNSSSDVNNDEDVSDDSTVSDSSKDDTRLSSAVDVLKSSAESRRILNQTTELLQSIFKTRNNALIKILRSSNSGSSSRVDNGLDKFDDKKFQHGKLGSISKTTEADKFKRKYWLPNSQRNHGNALLSPLPDKHNMKMESKDRNQWIKMSQWHTKDDSDSCDSGTPIATFPKRKQSETDDEIEDISPPKRSKTIGTDGGSSCTDSLPNIVRRNTINTVLNTKKRTVDGSVKKETSSGISPNKKTINIVVKAAIKLKEMFPNLTASEIGLKVRSVNNGKMTEEQLVQTVVEDIYSLEGNTGDIQKESPGDIQIALANPRSIQTSQKPRPSGQAKNQTTNSAKGKSLMKKVPKSNMDIDMDMDSGTDVEEVTVYKLEAVEIPVLEPRQIKLRWDYMPLLPNNAKILRFVVEMQTLPSEEWIVVAREVAGKVYLVSNLNSGKDYNFRVRARMGFGFVFDPSPVASVCRKDTKVEIPDIRAEQIKIPATITKPSPDQVVPAKAAPPVEDISQQEVSSSTLACEACQANTSFDKMVQCCDGHLNCNVCVEKVVKKILLHGSEETTITCCYTAWYECNSSIPESQAKKVLPSLVFELLEDKLNKKASETIEKMTDMYSCPACKFKVVIEGDLKKFDCPECKVAICRYCGKVWNETSSHSACTLNTFMASSNNDRTSILSNIPEGYKDFSAVELGEETQSELSFVLALFQKDSTGHRHRTPINRVFRVHNPKLWQKYCLAREHMIKDIGKDNINEQHLFHGTNTRAVSGICREGLDWRMCGENGTVFGQGSYFAKNSSYSLKYSHLGGFTRGKKIKPPTGFTFAPATNVPSPFSFGNSTHSIGQQHVQGNYPPNIPFALQGLIPPNSKNKPAFYFGANPVPANNNATSRPTFGVVPVSNPLVVNNNTSGTPTVGFGSQPVSNIPMANNSNTPVFQFGPLPVSSSSAVGFGPPTNNLSPSLAPDQSDISANEIPIEEQFLHGEKRYMFLARVLVGKSCVGHHGMRKPSRDNQNRTLNSACDNLLKPSIFVVFDSAQCYPEYLIELA